MEKVHQTPKFMDNESSVFIRMTMNQIIGFILGAVLLFSPLVWQASNYAAQFAYLQAEVTENKVVREKLTQSMQELTIEIKSLRLGLENVNKR